MKSLNALTIENQYAVDAEIHGLVKDNEDVFENLTEVVGCAHRKPEELIGYIDKHEALVISSTFSNKDQLEDLIELIANLEDEKYIFVNRLDTKLDDWKDSERVSLWFYDYEKFMGNLKKCFEKHKIFSFGEDIYGDDDYIKDEIWERMSFSMESGRGKFKINKLEYGN